MLLATIAHVRVLCLPLRGEADEPDAFGRVGHCECQRALFWRVAFESCFRELFRELLSEVYGMFSHDLQPHSSSQDDRTYALWIPEIL